MNRVVIRLGMHNQDEVSIGIEEPYAIANQYPGSVTLNVNVPQPARNGTWVQTIGESVYKRALASDGVRKALEDAAANGSSPVYVRLTSSDAADEVQWETLFHPQEEFLGLDARWPITRLVGNETLSSDDGVAGEDIPFAGALRITAVLAARDRDAFPEWLALYSELQNFGRRYRLHVITCQSDISDEIDALGQPFITCEYVPRNTTDLIRAINLSSPHLLHMFSHGSAGHGAGNLEIATVQGYKHKTPDGLISLEAKELANATRDCWLVVLNACEGADPGADARSFAYTLVALGTPAVVGMREKIDANDAHTFCRAIFHEVFHHIQHQLPVGIPSELDWPDVVRVARRQLIQGPHIDAATVGEWTLPALYLRPRTLRIARAEASLDPAAQVIDDGQLSNLTSQVRTLREVLDDSPEDTPANIIEGIKNRIQYLMAEIAKGAV
ncbi:MAG: CHAT domain-containing protein [Aestuariibacter sp.]|nr:CHAT domain-containing protein [Aestuariibacter sp.]